MNEKKIIIGSRESRLAVIQSEMVKAYIEEHNKDCCVELLTMKTTGDKILDRTLDKVGGKGLFVKELDRALEEGRSMLSVHSLKDMPMEVPEHLPLIAFSKREDPRDVLVLPEGAEELDETKPIGCSSLRRILQLKELYPHMIFESVRGNVQTRLKKLDEGQYSALILAAAGLKRLGLEYRISRYFEPEEVLPAAGQGILAVQGRKGEDYSYLEGYNDEDSACAAAAERAFVRYLNGGCSSPVAAYARVQGEKILLTGLYYEEETGAYRKASLDGKKEDAEALGIQLAGQLQNPGKVPGTAGVNEGAPEEEIQPAGQLQNTGKVWLVGAGPGDIGLFTLKGMEVLMNAQVVVYDSLVGQGVLSKVPKDARLINVGKRASHHTMPQEQINRVLAEEAKKGLRVVRLKGGDPFLFGRGGEELELLHKEGIPYEVVPGVTSPIAVPAYNGIPVTHRDFCSSLHIITGHKKQGEVYDIDFEALVRTKGTLVFLMGVTALPDICDSLLKAGMEPDMPAAILQKGTTAGQKRIVATVSTLPEEVKRRGIETPAIIVVGKVCGLAEDFAWYEKLPLAGWKVLVTRPKETASVMSGKLRSMGAEVLELPAICTEPLKDQHKLYEALGRLEQFEWIAFTSPIGVKVFFDEMRKSGTDIRKMGNARLAAIGQGTRKALEERGLFVDLMPEVYDGESLGKALCEACEGNEKILIPRAKIGGTEILERLAEKPGLTVYDVPTYDTFYAENQIIDLKKSFEDGEIDCAVFTSASTVRGFVNAVPGLDYSKVTAACIGKQTKAQADSYGMKTHMAKEATMDSLTELVAEMKMAH